MGTGKRIRAPSLWTAMVQTALCNGNQRHQLPPHNRSASIKTATVATDAVAEVVGMMGVLGITVKHATRRHEGTVGMETKEEHAPQPLKGIAMNATTGVQTHQG